MTQCCAREDGVKVELQRTPLPRLGCRCRLRRPPSCRSGLRRSALRLESTQPGAHRVYKAFG
eukprot:scaffold27248_cov133-Isochrysis_galbana.AAC.13